MSSADRPTLGRAALPTLAMLGALAALTAFRDLAMAATFVLFGDRSALILVHVARLLVDV
jgi:hypothetical protein